MKKLLSVTILAVLMLSLATPVFAQGGHDRPGQVTFGSDVRLEAGDVVNGDTILFGGDLRMADGSRIEGGVVVFGGYGKIDGEVDGDVAFIGGNVNLGPTARINGDVASVGGQIERAEGAYVRGQIIETTHFNFGRVPIPQIGPIVPRTEFGQGAGSDPLNRLFHIMLGFVRGVMVTLVISAIGLLVVLFLPDQTRVVGQAVRQATPTSFGLGLLTMIVGITVIVLLAITICLSPVSLLVALALVLATLYGWIVIGYLLGQRMLQAIQKNGDQPTPVASALVGIFTVTLVQQWLMVLGQIPCLGFFFWLLGAGLWLLVAATGLGAVVLSRFGTQRYTGGAAPRTPPPALPPTPPPPPAPPEPPSAATPEAEDKSEDVAPESEGEPGDTTPEPKDEAKGEAETPPSNGS
jgi:cytoskeletal protein CcmA (bactofilin family)